MDFNTIETSSDGEGNDVKPLEHSEEEKPHHHHSGGGGGGGDGASPGKIFIGGLAKETTPVQFTKHFGKYGEITDSVIMKDRVTGQPRGFGFVTYADPAVVDKVIDETHVINGKQVEIKRTIPKGAIGSKDFKTKKIFVGGIPTSVTEDEFKDFFSKYGEVSEHQIMRDHATSRSRGFGFITFESEQSVDSLLSQGNKIDFSGTQVEIKKAEPKKSNPPLPPSKRFSNSRSSYGSEYGDAYGGYGGGGGGFGGSSYRSGGGYGGRPGGYAGYGASEYGGGPGGYGYGGSNLGSYRGGEPSLGYGSRYGGGYGRGYDLGGGAGGYGGGSEGYGGGYGGYGGGADVGYGSSYDSGFGSGGGYRGSGGSSAAPYGNRGGYGGSGTSRYHPYSR